MRQYRSDSEVVGCGRFGHELNERTAMEPSCD
jgi:hypothetical protein